MSEPLHVGISTCPNDTFAFAGLLTQRVDPAGFDWQIDLADIEVLNRRFAAGDFDCAKTSFAAALELGADVRVLPVGAALGFGVGPLLLAAADRPAIPAADARVLVPGEHTTAALLYRLFHTGEGRVEHVLFSEIMPALERGEADYGVCIHEGRFTWRGRGLTCLEDLGERWESATAGPLPLGGLVARCASMPDERCARVTGAVRASLAWADAHREEALAVMRLHAAEQADEVLWRHVELYVNGETRRLGPLGRTALERLAALAAEYGLTPAGCPILRVAGA